MALVIVFDILFVLHVITILCVVVVLMLMTAGAQWVSGSLMELIATRGAVG